MPPRSQKTRFLRPYRGVKTAIFGPPGRPDSKNFGPPGRPGAKQGTPTHHLENLGDIGAQPTRVCHCKLFNPDSELRLIRTDTGPASRSCTFPPSRWLPEIPTGYRQCPVRTPKRSAMPPPPHQPTRLYAETWVWELVQREDGHGISASLLRNRPGLTPALAKLPHLHRQRAGHGNQQQRLRQLQSLPSPGYTGQDTSSA